MNVFEVVKENVTARQAAEAYVFFLVCGVKYTIGYNDSVCSAYANYGNTSHTGSGRDGANRIFGYWLV